MSVNIINYNKNKMIFSNLIGEKYTIIKDSSDKNILTINCHGKTVKCKYILFLIENNLRSNKKTHLDTSNDSLIIWSDGNPYIDQHTRSVSKIIRNTMKIYKKYLIDQNTQIITKSDLQNLINSLIKNQFNFLDDFGKSINCNWILTSKQYNTTEYYMITDVMYY